MKGAKRAFYCRQYCSSRAGRGRPTQSAASNDARLNGTELFKLLRYSRILVESLVSGGGGRKEWAPPNCHTQRDPRGREPSKQEDSSWRQFEGYLPLTKHAVLTRLRSSHIRARKKKRRKIDMFVNFSSRGSENRIFLVHIIRGKMVLRTEEGKLFTGYEKGRSHALVFKWRTKK